MATSERRRGARGGDGEDVVKRVLVADDDPGICDVLGSLLRDEGYDVLIAHTGEQTLKQLLLAESERPDIALVDQRLPDMKGIEVLDRVLEQGVDVPIILMTGYGTASLAIKAMQMGAADYLIKPFDVLEEITLAVARTLKYRELERNAGQQLASMP